VGDLSNISCDVISHDVFSHIKKPTKNLQESAKNLAVSLVFDQFFGG